VASSAGWAIFASADWLIFRPRRIGRVADDRAAAGVDLDRMRTRLVRLRRVRLNRFQIDWLLAGALTLGLELETWVRGGMAFRERLASAASRGDCDGGGRRSPSLSRECRADRRLPGPAETPANIVIHRSRPGDSVARENEPRARQSRLASGVQITARVRLGRRGATSDRDRRVSYSCTDSR